jgi:3-oxoacyl-[acyl-carrier protein] reductase
MDTSKFTLAGRVAVVTGAGGILGMGRATALAFADAGADVVVTDLVNKADSWDLEGTADAVRKQGRRVLVVQADLTKESEVAGLVKKTVREFGTIDVLANVAGVPAHAPFMEMTRELWDKGLDVNLRSVFMCCQAAGKVMMEHKRGSIINWSSSAGLKMGVLSVYGIAKIGIRHMTAWIAQDLAPYNIRCNAVAPGLIGTDFGYISVDGIKENSTPYHMTNEDKRAKEIPLGRVGDAADVADVALFLASDASRYITGVTIPVGGGLVMG